MVHLKYFVENIESNFDFKIVNLFKNRFYIRDFKEKTISSTLFSDNFEKTGFTTIELCERYVRKCFICEARATTNPFYYKRRVNELYYTI